MPQGSEAVATENKAKRGGKNWDRCQRISIFTDSLGTDAYCRGEIIEEK
jgi:hypothetical protein